MDLPRWFRGSKAKRRPSQLRRREFARRFAAELSIKPLENRYVFDVGITTQISLLPAGDLSVTDVTSGGRNDSLTIQADTSHTVRPYDYYLIQDPTAIFSATGVSGASVSADQHSVEIPFGAITGNLIQVESLGGEDSLTIDSSLGNFAHAIDFDGGAPVGGVGEDSLIIRTSNPATASPLFSFAGFTFDQGATPNHAEKLSTGTYTDGPDPFTISLTPGNPTGVVLFPESNSGFLGNLSIGSELDGGSTVRAINLPAGNVGTEFRSGVELDWSGQSLMNVDGDDFVVYESSSNPTGPDGFLVQVRATGGDWSRLRYEPHDARQNYVGNTSDGAFATAFDLSSFDIAPGQTIDGIRILSLTSSDRIDPVDAVYEPRAGANVGFGYVIPADNGQTSNIFPDPGPLASFTFFGNSTFDPDPLYVGALHPLAGPTSFRVDEVTITDETVVVTSGGLLQPVITYRGVEALTVQTQAGEDSIQVYLSADLPGRLLLDGGDPSVGDEVQIFGSSASDAIVLAGDQLTVNGGTTIQLLNFEKLQIDVAGGDADTIINEPTFRLNGNDAALNLIGDSTDRYTLRTESPPVTPTGGNHSFAGFEFKQSATPDVFYTLPLGQLPGGQGVIINGSPYFTNHVDGFPQNPAGFDESLSIGGRLGGTDATLQALRLPTTLATGSDPGATVRGGFELRWSDGRALTNGTGAELVLYESGTYNGALAKGAPEPIMVQVHNPDTDTWSNWVYVPATSFMAYGGGSTGDGAFATLIDLGSFGTGFGTVDALRFTNAIATDRMQTTGSLFVTPGETGLGGTVQLNPGSLASFTQYGNSTFDPDPLYVGVLSSAVVQVTVSRNDVVALNPDGVEWIGYHDISYEGFGTVAVETFGGGDQITVDPSSVTSYEINAGLPGFPTNPGDRVTIDLDGVVDPLLEVTGVGSGIITHGGTTTIVLQGVESLGGVKQADNSVIPLDMRVSSTLVPGDDAYRLSRNNLSFETRINEQLYFRADLDIVDELQFNDPVATTTLPDLQTLTIDFAGGNTIPQGGVFFHGGQTGSGQAQITLENGSLGLVRNDFLDGTTGNVAFSPTLQIAADSTRLHYLGVAGDIVDHLVTERRELLFNDDRNEILLQDNGDLLDSHLQLASAAAERTFVTAVFRNPAQTLVAETRGGDDEFHLLTLDSRFLAELRLDTGVGHDTIRIDSNGSEDGGTVDVFKFPIFVSAGGDGADQLIVNDEDDETNDVFSITDNTIGGGPVPAGAAVDAEGVPSPVIDSTFNAAEWEFAPVAFATGARPATDLQSILHFDFSTAGTTVPDGSLNNANTGYLPQSPALQFRPDDGKFGGALEFNGTSDYAWFQFQDQEIGDEGTLNLWVKLDTVTRRNMFFEGPGNTGLEFQYRDSGTGQFYGSTNRGLVGNTDDFAITSGGGAATAGQWVNVQYTWKKTTATTGEMHVYVNGVEAYLAGSDSNIANWSVVASTANAFMTMGRDASVARSDQQSGGTRYFDGMMDDVAWFDTVLTPAELAAMRTQSVADAQASLHGNLDPLGVGDGNLIAYWNLDDAIGTTEIAGNLGTSITLHAGPAGSQAQFGASGKFNGALDFTNSESFATFQSSDFDVGTKGSVSFWVYMRDTTDTIGGNNRRAVFFEGSDNNGFEFQYRPNTNGQFYGSPSRGSGNTLENVIQSGGARTAQGNWQHVVYTWDRSNSVGNSGTMRIYINGVETPYLSSSFDQNISGWSTVINTVNQEFTVGRDPGNPERWFDGKMDDVSWYNSVLSTTQISSIYNGGSGRSIDSIQATPGHDATFNSLGAGGNLIAYWNLDDAPGTMVATGDGGTNVALRLNVPAILDGATLDLGGGPTLTGAATALDALAFDGDRDVLRVLDSSSLDFNKSQGTIAFWVKPQAPNNGQTSYTLVEDTNQQIEVSLSFVADAGASLGNANLTQRIVFTPLENAGGTNVIVSGSQLDLNEWTHVLITWDQSTQSARIFLNGVEDTPLLNMLPTQWNAIASDTGDWVFGGDAAASPANRYFRGSLSDVAIYGSALTQNQVSDIFTRGAGASGGWDYSGAQGRFAWDDTHLYALIEGYDQDSVIGNDPFSDVLLELVDGAGNVLGTFTLANIGAAGGQVNPGTGGSSQYEIAIPWSAIDGVNGFNHLTDVLQYRVRTDDAALPAGTGGFDSRDTTLGFEVIPPSGPTAGYKLLPLAKSETYFGTGGFVQYAGVADLSVTAGEGDDTITIRDNPLTDGVIDASVNPSRSFSLYTGPGIDSVTIKTLDANYRASTSIYGDSADTITQIGQLTLGSSSSLGNLYYSAGTIVVEQFIKTLDSPNEGTVKFVTSGTLTLLENADITSRGTVEQIGSLATIFTAADITTTDDRIEFDGQVRLTGHVSMNSAGVAAGNIHFRRSIDSFGPGQFNLTLASGASNIEVGGTVGFVEALQDLTIVSAHNLTFGGTVRIAGDLVQVAGTGTTTFHGTSETGIGGLLTLLTDTVQFLAASVITAGDVTIDAKNAILFAGGVGLDAGASLIALKANQDGNGTSGFSQGSGSLIHTSSNEPLAIQILVGGSGDAAIAQLQTGTTSGEVTIDVGGAITDAQADEAANVTAFRATLAAESGVGVLAPDGPNNPDFDTAVAQITIQTTHGDIALNEQDNIQLQGLLAPTGSIRVVSANGLISILDGTFLQSGTSLQMGKGQVSNAPPLLALAEDNANDVLLPGDPTQEVRGTIGGDLAVDFISPNQELGRNLTITVDWADGQQSVLSGLKAGDKVEWFVSANNTSTVQITPGAAAEGKIDIFIQREYPLFFLQSVVGTEIVSNFTVSNDSQIQLFDQSGTNLNQTVPLPIATSLSEEGFGRNIPLPVEKTQFIVTEQVKAPRLEPPLTLPTQQVRYYSDTIDEGEAESEVAILYLVRIGPDGLEESRTRLPLSDLRDLDGLLERIRRTPMRSGLYRIYHQEPGLPPRQVLEFRKTAEGIGDPVREPGRGANPLTDPNKPAIDPAPEAPPKAQPDAKQGAAVQEAAPRDAVQAALREATANDFRFATRLRRRLESAVAAD